MGGTLAGRNLSQLTAQVIAIPVYWRVNSTLAVSLAKRGSKCVLWMEARQFPVPVPKIAVESICTCARLY